MNGEPQEKSRQHYKTLLRFAVSFGAIGTILFMFRHELPAVIGHLRQARLELFVAGVLIYYAGLLPVAFRLRLVLRVQRTRLSIPALYYMNLVALFFNNVLPSSVGGDMVKAYYIYRHANGRVSSFSAVVVDRLFGLLTMVLIGVSAIVLFDNAQATPKIVGSVLFLGAATGVVALFIFNRRIVDTVCSLHIPLLPRMLLEKLRGFYQAMFHYRAHKGIIPACIFLTFLGQLTFIIANYLLARSMAIDISLAFFFFFVPIILIMGLTPSVNGIGVREATYLFYLTEFTTPDRALALSLLTSFFMIFVGIVGGVVYAFKGGLSANAADQVRLE